LGDRPNLPRVWRGQSIRARVIEVVRPHRARAWRHVTAGMLISRDEYGEQTKRFYFRGLPPAERERFAISTRGGIRKRHPVAPIGTRAWRDEVAIVAPSAWSPTRPRRRRGPIRSRTRRHDPSTESLGAILESLFGSRRAGLSSINRCAPLGAPSADPDQGRWPSGRTADHIPDHCVAMRRVTKVPASLDTSDILAWGERMAEIARRRERGG
jgi:hypothetical protein